MASIDMSPAIARLDTLCDQAHATARRAIDANWSAGLREATAALASDLEQLAGELDQADEMEKAKAVVIAARDTLPRCFAEFGVALADDLIREFRVAAGGALGDADEGAPRVPMPRRARKATGGAI